MRLSKRHGLWALLGLIALLVILVLALLLTQAGSRLAIRTVIQYYLPTLSIGRINGALALELELSDIAFTDKGNHITLESLSYHIRDIRLWRPALALSAITVDNLVMNLAPTTDNTTKSDTATTFEGFTLPLAFRLDKFTINHLSIINLPPADQPQPADTPPTVINNISLSSLVVRQDVWSIASVTIDAPMVELNLAANGKLDAQLAFNAQGDWQVNSDQHTIQGNSQFTGDRQNIHTQHELTLHTKQQPEGATTPTHLPIGVITVEGNVDLSTPTPAFALTAKSQQLQLEPLTQQPITLNDWMLSVTGTPANYHVHSTLALANQAFTPAQVTLKGQGNRSAFELTTATIQAKESRIDSTATIVWSPGITIDTNISLKDVNPALYHRDWPGLLNGQITAKGVTEDGSDKLAFMLEHTIKGTLKQQPLSIVGAAKMAGGINTLEATTIVFGNNRLEASGTLHNERIDLQLTALLNDLSLFNNSRGKISANATVKGQLATPSVDVTIKGKDLRYQSHRISTLTVNAQGNPHEHISAKAILSHATIAEHAIKHLQLDLAGNFQQHTLTAALDSALLNTQASLTGRMDEPNKQWHGNLTQHQLSLTDHPGRWTLQAPAAILAGNAFALSPLCWRNARDNLCIEATGNLSEHQYSVNVTTDKLSSRLIKHYLPPELALTGWLKANAHVAIANDNIRITSKADVLDGQVTYHLDDTTDYQTDITRASLSSQPQANGNLITLDFLTSDNNQLNASLRLPLALGVNTPPPELDGSINAVFTRTDYFAALTPEISTLKGQLHINGNIRGNIQQPQLQLHATLNEGDITLTKTGTGLQQLTLDIANTDQKTIGFTLSANNQQQPLSINGQWRQTGAAFNQWQLDGTVKGNDFLVVDVPEMRLSLSPKLTISATPEKATITGDMNVEQLNVTVKKIPDGVQQRSSDVVIHQPDKQQQKTASYPLYYSVNTTITDNAYVDVLGLKANLQGNLRVDNREKYPQTYGYGKLDMTNGSYAIYGQTLTIEKGELLFNGPIDNPGLDVKASRRSNDGDVLAGVAIFGTVNRLESSLYSDPALSDLAILSYILTGKGPDDKSELNSEQLLQAALLLGLKRTALISELQGTLGVDVLTIDSSGNTADSRLEAGKYLNDQLYTGYSYGLFNRVGFWLLRYQLTKALKLESRYGEQGSVDVIYEIKRK